MKSLGWKLINTWSWKLFLLPMGALIVFIVFVWLFIFTKNQNKVSVSPLQATTVPSQIPSLITSASPFLSQPTKKLELVKVLRVIDGDTIELEGGRKVRYIGVDTPELADKRTVVKCFAEKALVKNKELVEGSIVNLVKDISETDRYNRLLRYVYKEDIFINELLVREGYAYAASFPPDITYQEKLSEAQREAREKKTGLWGNVCV